MRIQLSKNQVSNKKRIVEKSRDEWISVWGNCHKSNVKNLENNIKYIVSTKGMYESFSIDELINNGTIRFGLTLKSDKTVNHDTGKTIKSRDEWTDLDKKQADEYFTEIRISGFFDKLFEVVKDNVVNEETISITLDALWNADDYSGKCNCVDSQRHHGNKKFGIFACKHVLYLGDLNKHVDTYKLVKAELIKIICQSIKSSIKFNRLCAEHGCENGLATVNVKSRKRSENNMSRYNKYNRQYNRVVEDYDDIIVDINEDFEDEFEDEYDAVKYTDDTSDMIQGESTFDINALYLDCNTVLEAIQNDTVLSCHGVQVTDIIDRIDRANEGEIVDDIDRKFIDMLLGVIKVDSDNTTDDEYVETTFDTEDEYEDNTFDVDDAEIEYESRCGVRRRNRRKENGRQYKHCSKYDKFDIVNEFDDPYDDYEDVYSNDYFDNDGDDFANDYVGRSISDYRDDYSDDYSYRPIRRRRNQW